MEFLDFFTKTFSSIGGLGFLVGIIILYKAGVLEFLKGWKKNGNNGDYQYRISDLESHAKVANEEMHEIRMDISQIKSDVSFIKGKLDAS